MKVTVDKDTCTGCGLCNQTCPDVFDVEDDIAKVKVNPVPKEHEAAVRESADGCPVEAIKIEE